MMRSYLTPASLRNRSVASMHQSSREVRNIMRSVSGILARNSLAPSRKVSTPSIL